PVAFVPPWRGSQNPDAVTGASPKVASFNQAIGIVAPSVVGINTSGGLQQSASGIVVHHIGYVLTNHHVVHGAKNITVTLTQDQMVKSFSAQIFDSREDLDLAIIKIKSTGNEVFTPAPMINSNNIYIGQQIVAIGNPFGLSQSASSGIVSNPDRTLTTANKTFNDLIQTDASINPGSSGGALINSRGEVIGINTAIYSPTQAFSGISFAVPIGQAQMAFPDLIEIVQSPLANTNPSAASTPRAAVPVVAAAPGAFNLQMMAAKTPGKEGCWLGLHAYPVDKIIAEQLNLPTQYGILVNRIFDNSPAAKAGLMEGDVILRADSKRIRDENMLWTFLEKKKSGDKVNISVLRNGSRKLIVTTLQPKTPNINTLSTNATRMPPASGTIPPAPSAALPSPLEQNAAGKKFIEGHWLGLEVIPLTAELATEYKIPKGENGILVDEVTLEAAESGILAGDMIQVIGGLPVRDLREFFNVTQRERVQEAKQVQVGVSRRGRKMSFLMIARNTTMLGFAQMEAAQPIQPGALRPHRYMGVCTDCHIFMKTGGQLATDAGDILPNPPAIPRDAKPGHRDRGQCNSCHTILPAGARIAPARPTPPPIPRNAKAPHAYRGLCANCHTIR
ncbi:MAG: PDZ domain-containing protein, partial [Planctomycetes bacterium]|nr:PDZ domain-containing protein [Planctomycetota bacterium]